MTSQTYTDAQIKGAAKNLQRFAEDAISRDYMGCEREAKLAVKAARMLRSLLSERQAAMQGQGGEHCPYCDNTGDVHGIDGEWRGECTECKSPILVPDAYLHMVVDDDGAQDSALSFSSDSFPLQGVGGFKSIACYPLFCDPLQSVRSVSEEDVDGAEDAYNEISVTNSCNRKALRAALENFAAIAQEKQS